MRTGVLLRVGGAIVLAMLALSAWAWGQLPDGVDLPVHWGPGGEPDGYGPKWLALLGLPATAAFMVGLLALIPRIEPRRHNLARSGPAYVAIGIAAIGLIGVIHVVAVMSALGAKVDMTAVVCVASGTLFVVVGNFLGKTRSNWLFGIRTPWTLSSERSWTLTHRLGGWLFVALGLAIILATPALGSEVALWIMLGGLPAMVVVLFAYSYLVWRDDPSGAAEASSQHR